ncbi:MAG: hypothetical protein Kapaf2KO_08910 [Candidatus Kapaibacteriales bacterium]
MKKIALAILVALSISLSSCNIIQPYIEQWFADKIKEAFEADRDPPPGYDPKFISKVEQMNDTITDPYLAVSSVDMSDPSKVKIYAHLINDDNSYVTGAADGAFKDMWCGIYDTTNGNATFSKNITVREITEREAQDISMSLVMDLSGSMGEARAKRMQEAVKDLINDKDSRDKMGLVRYDTKVESQLLPTSDRNSLNRTHTISGLQGFGGGTATTDAIYEGITQVKGEPANLRKSVIVFTDGIDNSSQKTVDEVVQYARDNNVILNTIDYGYNINTGYLENIAKETNGIYHHIYTQDEFQLLFKDVYNRLNNYYVIEYTPETYGKHLIGVKLCTKDQELIASADFENTPRAGDIALLDINFDTNKSDIKKDQEPKIQNLLTLMKSKPNLRIELQGHTDDRGDDELNKRLSQDRANAVKDYLTANGINASRITAVGYGEDMPIASNQTEEGRALNRRTQFKVLK